MFHSGLSRFHTCFFGHFLKVYQDSNTYSLVRRLDSFGKPSGNGYIRSSRLSGSE